MRYNIILIVATIFCAMGCNGLYSSPDETSNERRDIVLTRGEAVCKDASNELAFNLIGSIERENQGSSYFFSPLSVSFELGLLATGAESRSKEQIQHALKIESLDDMNFFTKTMLGLLPDLDKKTQFYLSNITLSNSRRGVVFKDSYKEIIQKNYAAFIDSKDFSSPKTVSLINDWGSSSTGGRIKGIGDKLSASDIFFIANAAYFKGDWALDYFSKTKKERFTMEDGTTLDVDMMEHSGQKVSYSVYDKFTAASLDYGNGSFSLRVFLPNSGYAVSEIINDVSEAYSGQVKAVESGFTTSFKLPKFQGSYGFDLARYLVELGITDIFDPKVADFGSMTSYPQCHVTGLWQDSFISIDEKGTEAAAVTYTAMALGVIKYSDVILDRPFLYMITEKSTGTILFAGKFAGK